MDHAVDALREAGEGFLLNLVDLERPRHRGDGPRHRRPGHCPDSRTRRLAPRTRRIQSPLQDAAGRDRAAARLRRRRTLADLGQERARATCAMPMPPMCGRPKAPASRTPSSATSNCSKATQRAEMSRALNGNAGVFRAAADRGRRRTAHLRRPGAESRRRQRRHRDRRQRGDRAARRTGADGGGAPPHPRPVIVRRRRIRRPAAARLLQRILSAAVGPRSARSSTPIPDDSSVLDRLRAARKLPEQPDFRAWKAKLHEAYRAVEPENDTWFLPDGRARQRRHHAESRRRRHLSVRQCHRKPRSGAAVRRPDPGPARNARQSHRSGRGVRQQRPRAIVQSGFRQDVEAVARGAAGTAAYRDRGSLVQAAVRRRC